jgi:hypothetical protein
LYRTHAKHRAYLQYKDKKKMRLLVELKGAGQTRKALKAATELKEFVCLCSKLSHQLESGRSRC